MNDELLVITTRLGAGALAAVFSIAVWARTREAAWLFVVLGILALYAETIWSIGQSFGFTDIIMPRHIAWIIPVLLSALPFVFFTAACVALLVKKSRP